VCISAVARDSILDRLRRDRSLPISVAHPGGDHVPIDVGADPGITTFLRLGTLEARKMPIEILEGFLAARKMVSTPMELHFLGAPSASDTAINHAVSEAAARNIGVHWIQSASDAEVSKALQDASMFLSIGVEGYGIPVLEAIRRGTPVLFDGVQPAAELMIGRGARHVRALTADAMRDCFITYAERGNRSELQAELDPESVPAWSEFTRGVIDALYAAHR
jgi:glycosyltransferase involved in cell wall biosynthesis